jgi:hypothetical protein
MIKSNLLKQVPYPTEFSEDDKALYDKLYAESKIIHAEIERDTPFIIHYAIIAHIRDLNGNLEPLSDTELETMKELYKLTATEFKCEEPPDSYLYDKENNPMYFPATLTISDDTNSSNIVIKSNGANDIENNSNAIVEEDVS